MDRSTELRLPTIAVPVTLAMIGGDTETAELFVSDASLLGHSNLMDDLAGILDDSAVFVPARVGDTVQLVAKHALRWVSIVKDNELTLHDRQHHVRVHLGRNEQLEGTLLDDAPQDRPRAIDHLNGAGKFVRLWTSDQHYLINKVHIVTVIEVPATGVA